MSRCIVKPLTEEFSGCLKEEPGCPYAAKFGFSYHCQHPDHLKLAKDSLSSFDRVELYRRYRELRELRRKKFIKDLGMPVQECVSRIVDMIRKDIVENKEGGEQGSADHTGDE